MDFNDKLRTGTEEIETIIKDYLPLEEGPQKTVIEAMNYSVLAGGKRLRPMLMLETYRMLGGKGRVVEPFMAALEMIHTYSLVHDDLPAMDNDQYRRGKLTTHAAYGETMGILAGDALLNYAFETALSAFDLVTEGSKETKRVVKATRILAHNAGIYGMIGGQVVDVESERSMEASPDTLLYIHKNKTAAMIESAMVIGAVLAGASGEDQEKIRQIAEDVGIAFQIQDDILDVISTTEVLGKPVGSDDRNDKLTYVSLKGLDQAKEDVRSLSERALSVLETFTNKDSFLYELIQSLINRIN